MPPNSPAVFTGYRRPPHLTLRTVPPSFLNIALERNQERLLAMQEKRLADAPPKRPNGWVKPNYNPPKYVENTRKARKTRKTRKARKTRKN